MLTLSFPGLGALTLPLGCTLFGKRGGYEEAGYSAIENDDAFEVRQYEARVVVQTVVDADFKTAGNQAFRKLFKYISGNNRASSKIAMTTPVIADESTGEKIAMTTPVMGEQQSTDRWCYRFVLPATYTLANAPQPTDPEVTLAELPARKVAAIRYTGRSSEQRMREKTAGLQAWITAHAYEATSEPQFAGYDPPWTLPPFRRNEILIEIK